MAESSRTGWRIVGIMLVIGIGAAVWTLRPSPPENPRVAPPDKPELAGEGRLDRETSQKLLERRNLSLGWLENHQFEEATAEFVAIEAVLPGELFAVRNRAISLVKQTVEKIDERSDAAAFSKSMEASRLAIQRLAELEPNTGLPQFLRAVLATKSGEAKDVAESLRLAIKADPTNVPWKFQYFELGRSLRDPAEKAAALAAGLSAAELAPDNLFVQKEVLAENLSNLAKMAPEEAASPADDILARLEKLREPLRVLGISIQVQAKADVVAVLDNVLTAIREKNWQTARNEFFKIKNLLAQETASDADLIHPHPLTYHDPLNYVSLDFSPAFYERTDLPEETLPKIQVNWKATEGDLPDVSASALQLSSLDFDLDGIDDLVELGRTPASLWQLAVYRRRPDRSGWYQTTLEIEPPPGLHRLIDQPYQEFLWADLDDDVVDQAAPQPGELGPVNAERCHEADLDFVLYGPSGVVLINNVLDPATKVRRLEAIPAEKAGFGNLKDVTHAKLADFDHDGDLDLVTIAARKLGLWINLGNFTFQDVRDRSLMPPDDFQVTALAVLDWDRDNDLDILLAGGAVTRGFPDSLALPNAEELPVGGIWMENLRHGRLRFHDSKHKLPQTDKTEPRWHAPEELIVADFDGNGGWDIVTVSIGWDDTRLARGRILEIDVFLGEEFPDSSRHFKKSATRIFKYTEERLHLIDFDNDGGQDLVIADGSMLSIWRNMGNGEFEEPVEFAENGGINSSYLQTPLFTDIDADGDLDLVANSDGKLRLLTNEGGNQNHLLNVRFRGQQVKANEQGASKRVNHYGIGNTVELKAGNRYQAQIADGPTTRFGLGPAEQADIVRVLATNGVPQNRIEPKANELICERQILLSSCPYLYTWNGTRYEFVTDLVWASPLGLKASQTALVPWRDWEYLKIDGSKLQPVDGEYRLQITEELWEAGYFDQVKLIAVDHPSDVEIYTNEKVGSAELAAHKIHTARTSIPPRYFPAKASDRSGVDWRSALEFRDENFTRTFQRKLAQGLCEEHYLELELDPMAQPRERIMLYLTGWLRPTDTNINVALDQNPDLPSPTGLALWTPDAFGNWREVSPHVGFPNGKTKTVVMDLSQAFTPGDYRLRLVGNRELYWDHAFFSVDEEPTEIREYELPLLKADLHDRGVSRGILPAGDGPETYDYDQLAAIPPWPRMDGMFTRFGDVRPLIEARDDRLVVLGAGDEMSLSFQVPTEPLPDGWTRDFVLYNVGWVKDCLLNTWEGQRVEPLPFAAMQDHDYWTGRPDETGGYADYLRTYQIRRQASNFRSFVQRWTPAKKSAIPQWERDRRTGD